jgi:hypothetical protein
MDDSTIWPSFRELYRRSRGKKVIFWGCYDYFERTIKEGEFAVEYLVDSSKGTQGPKAHHGYDVKDPSVLKDLTNKDEYYVIISSTAFYEIVEDLRKFNFLAGSHFCVTPILRRFEAIDQLQNISAKVLFSSSDAVRRNEVAGGGLYRLETGDGNLTKLYSGITRGFCFFEGRWYIVDAGKGISILNANFEIEGLIELPRQSTPHGLAIDRERRRIYVVLSTRDEVAGFDLANGECVDSITLTPKFERTGRYSHHFNDIAILGDRLFISMFSITGNVANFIYDGGIVEYDLQGREFFGHLVRDLWQPHSVRVINQSLCFLDSMRGHLHTDWHKVETVFNGFMRGLDFDGQYWYLGQSVHRYFDRGHSSLGNMSVDSGVVIYDGLTRLTRVIQTPRIRDLNTIFLETDHCQ